MNYIRTIILFFAVAASIFAQNDSLKKAYEENSAKIDSLNLKVANVILTGNRVTDDDIITREMVLKRGSKFTLKKYSDDIMNIYNLALFTKVEIIPIPSAEKEITLNVDVKERWYILPLPDAGIDDGEWKKVWVGLNLRWDNFRGRNERVNLGFKAFYNPSISARYYVPWIGEKLHLFLGIGGSWQRTRNQSLEAVGRSNGGNTITYNDENYENTQYKGELTLGRYFGKHFSVFTDYRYNYLRVSVYRPGRTISTDGSDNYLSLGAGIAYDTRDLYEYATKGIYFRTGYLRSGFIDKEIDFGRFSLENQSFIPVYFKKDYYITVASKLYTNIGIGAIIPVYDHQFLGYGSNYVRGWTKYTFEGDDVLAVYNEIRIPIIKPRYIKAVELPIVRSIPIIKNLDIRHGLYFTLIYDIGAVWYKDQNIFKQKFISGAGMGINIIAPFGYVLRADWVFRLAKPVVGQIGFSLNAKF